MKDTQINAAIAEACGWEPLPEGYFHPDNPIGQTPPNYCTDLNAMHEAEVKCIGNSINPNQAKWHQYFLTLQAIAGPLTIIATARQRAEAFLRTLGKWEEPK
jgi:hypothetical protein